MDVREELTKDTERMFTTAELLLGFERYTQELNRRVDAVLGRDGLYKPADAFDELQRLRQELMDLQKQVGIWTTRQEWQVLVAEDLSQLQDVITARLSEGWTLHGSILLCMEAWAQAVVRNKYVDVK